MFVKSLSRDFNSISLVVTVKQQQAAEIIATWLKAEACICIYEYLPQHLIRQENALKIMKPLSWLFQEKQKRLVRLCQVSPLLGIALSHCTRGPRLAQREGSESDRSTSVYQSFAYAKSRTVSKQRSNCRDCIRVAEMSWMAVYVAKACRP